MQDNYLRNCQQIDFLTLNGFCLLSKARPDLFLSLLLAFTSAGIIVLKLLELHLTIFEQNIFNITISLSCHEQVCLSGLRFEIYVSHHRARWWEKYLSKRSPLKHTCLWHDKLNVLWILKWQVKISLRIK